MAGAALPALRRLSSSLPPWRCLPSWLSHTPLFLLPRLLPPSSPPCLLQECCSFSSPVRAFTTRSSANNYLVQLLQMEMEDQLQQEAEQDSLKGSPGTFEIFDTPGRENVILRRDMGKEQIEVECWLEVEELDGQDEHQEEIEGLLPCLCLLVKLTKGAEKPILEIRCHYYRQNEAVTVQHALYLADGRSEETDSLPGPYHGPDFMALDENIQQAFSVLIKARGITATLATYLMDYLAIKERREYMRWLQNVQTFFKS